MNYQTALLKKITGDWVLVSKITGLTPANCQVTSLRPSAKKYKMVMDALVKVVESRELMLSNNI